MNKIIIALTIVLFGCGSSEKTKESVTKHTDAEEQIKYTAPQIILPASEFEITNGGIGMLLLGASFDSIEYAFNDNIVDTLTMSSEGIDWKAKRINLGNGEWILVEDTGNNGTIGRLHTNSSRYKSKKGVFVGQKFSDVVKKKGDDVGISIDEGIMSIYLYDEAISISVDTISEREFYNSSTQELKDIPQSATVSEIGI